MRGRPEGFLVQVESDLGIRSAEVGLTKIAGQLSGREMDCLLFFMKTPAGSIFYSLSASEWEKIFSGSTFEITAHRLADNRRAYFIGRVILPYASGAKIFLCQ